MPFPLASWESPRWRSEFLPHASVQSGRHQLQLVSKAVTEGELPRLSPSNSLFFRPLDSEENGNFVVTWPCGPPFHSYRLGPRQFDDMPPRQMSVELDDALREGNFGRVFFLSGDGELRGPDDIAHYFVVVGATGWGQWMRLDADDFKSQGGLRYGGSKSLLLDSAAFLWTHSPDTERFQATPALKLWSDLQSQLQIRDSDYAFARRAIELPHRDVMQVVARWNQEKHAELYRVLRAAFLSHIEADVMPCAWTVKLDKFKSPWHKGEVTSLPQSPYVSPSDTPDILRGILRRISPYFEPASVADLFLPHLELERWQNTLENPLSIPVEVSTAHERLEASLFWQEWQEAHPVVK